jgi:hypothetical protein
MAPDIRWCFFLCFCTFHICEYLHLSHHGGSPHKCHPPRGASHRSDRVPPNDHLHHTCHARRCIGSRHGPTRRRDISAQRRWPHEFILAFVVVCCCCRRPRKQVKRRRSDRSSYASSSDGWSGVLPNENWTRPVPVPVQVGRGPTPVQYPSPVAQRGRMREPMREQVREQIPGGPKFPTYRAIPIPNPRRGDNPPRTYSRPYWR